jgi:hypothetical protein
MKSFAVATILAAGGVITPLAAYAGCNLFEHRDYGGASWYMEAGERLKMVNGESVGCSAPGCENVYYEPSWNDSVSSFKVDSGCRLTLWEHVNQGGAHFRTSKSYKYVGGDWNDVASEAVCTCR